jgi:hypothetical protein
MDIDTRENIHFIIIFIYNKVLTVVNKLAFGLTCFKFNVNQGLELSFCKCLVSLDF